MKRLVSGACVLMSFEAMAVASPLTMLERQQIYTVNADATYRRIVHSRTN